MPEKMSDELLYDERLIERHLQRGLLTHEAVEQWRQKAKDCAEQFQALQVEGNKGSAQATAAKD